MRSVAPMVVVPEPVRDGRAKVVDQVAFGAAVVVLGVVSVATGDDADTGRALDFGAIWMLALATGVVVLARRIPATAALATFGITVLWFQLGYASAIVTVPYLVAFYLLGQHGDRLKELLVGGVAVAGSVLAILGEGDQSARDAAAAVGWTLAALLLGELSNHRRMLLAEHEERARRAVADAERDAARRVAQDQLEIARDLHDVLAHTVAVMIVQAAAGREALDRGDHAHAGTALDTIRRAGREATGEVQALVAVLRAGTAPPATAPVPDLGRIADLAEVARSAGVDVEVDVDAGDVPEVAALTAYRVVQEALTNIARHSGARRADVTVRRQGSHLVVTVADDGSAAAPAPAGHGLRGMRERVEALGGTLRAGPAPDRGWRVEAWLPQDGGRSA